MAAETSLVAELLLLVVTMVVAAAWMSLVTVVARLVTEVRMLVAGLVTALVEVMRSVCRFPIGPAAVDAAIGGI